MSKIFGHTLPGNFTNHEKENVIIINIQINVCFSSYKPIVNS